MAKSPIAHSGRFSERMATRSPCFTPRWRSAVATLRTVSWNSGTPTSTHAPFFFDFSTAGRSTPHVTVKISLRVLISMPEAPLIGGDHSASGHLQPSPQFGDGGPLAVGEDADAEDLRRDRRTRRWWRGRPGRRSADA